MGQAYREVEKQLGSLIDKLKSCQHLCIYGAGNRAKALVKMQRLGFLDMRTPECFLVTMRNGNRESVDNPLEIDRIPVFTLEEYCMGGAVEGRNRSDAELECGNAMECQVRQSVFHETIVLVAVMEHYHQEVRERLQEAFFQDILFLTDKMERVLAAQCVEYYYRKLGMPFFMTDMEPCDCHKWDDECSEELLVTYMIKCEQDTGIEEEMPSRKWVVPLQAGAALTEKRICDVTDADGENISAQNAYYNEMTGLYWIWKNTAHQFSGICHYRRQFESDVALQPLLEGRADVIMPVPAIVYPDLEGYYRNWGEEEYYRTMLQVIEEWKPSYYETAMWCAKHEIFYPNNIFIAKREIMEDYCQFAFPILMEVESRMERRQGKKQKRCWLSEHVTTVYFIKHCRDYRIVFSNLKRYW